MEKIKPYSIKLVPKKDFKAEHEEEDMKRLINLEIIRRNSSIIVGMNYLEKESYYVNINLKNLSYKKSYKLKKGKEWVNKKDILISDPLELKRIRGWICSKLLGVVYSEYKKVPDKQTDMAFVKKDLEKILEILS